MYIESLGNGYYGGKYQGRVAIAKTEESKLEYKLQWGYISSQMIKEKNGRMGVIEKFIYNF